MSKIMQEFKYSSLEKLTIDLMIGTSFEVARMARQVQLPEHVRRVRDKTDQSNPVRKTQAA